MKALTIKQPYAHAIDLCYKKIEIRSWSTPYRGQILITSSAKPVITFLDEQLPTGTTVCVVELVDCKPMQKKDARDSMVAFHKDHVSWHLRFLYTVKKLPVKGKLGLWTPDMKLIVRDKPNPNRKKS